MSMKKSSVFNNYNPSEETFNVSIENNSSLEEYYNLLQLIKYSSTQCLEVLQSFLKRVKDCVSSHIEDYVIKYDITLIANLYDYCFNKDDSFICIHGSKDLVSNVSSLVNSCREIKNCLSRNIKIPRGYFSILFSSLVNIFYDNDILKSIRLDDEIDLKEEDRKFLESLDDIFYVE